MLTSSTRLSRLAFESSEKAGGGEFILELDTQGAGDGFVGGIACYDRCCVVSAFALIGEDGGGEGGVVGHQVGDESVQRFIQ